RAREGVACRAREAESGARERGRQAREGRCRTRPAAGSEGDVEADSGRAARLPRRGGGAATGRRVAGAEPPGPAAAREDAEAYAGPLARHAKSRLPTGSGSPEESRRR